MPWHDHLTRASDPSPNEFASWLAPGDAFGHLPGGVSQDLVNRLLKRLQDESLFAAAAIVKWRDDKGRIHQHQRMTIDSRWWMNAQDAQVAYSNLWSDGEVTCLIFDYDDDETYSVNFYGVKFEWRGIYDAVPGLEAHRALANVRATRSPLDRAEAAIEKATAATDVAGSTPTLLSDLYPDPDLKRMTSLEADVATLKASPAKTSPHPGGKPPKPWWDDLWVEIFRQIWEGDLKPTAMAHIADAMLQWASDNGHEMHPSTAKRAARKLWPVVRPEGS